MTMMLARYKGKKVKVHTGQRQTLGIKRNRACSALLSCSLALLLFGRIFFSHNMNKFRFFTP
jgi:hypothetical protein